MKGFLALILFLCVFPAVAANSCRLIQVEGKVYAHKDYFELRVAPETRSEVKLRLPILVQSKVFPYIDQFVSAELLIEGKELTQDSEIVEITKIKRSVPDPLNAGEATYKKDLGESKCR